MTDQRELKRQARARAAVTGESYAAARARLAGELSDQAADMEAGRRVFLWLASRGAHTVAPPTRGGAADVSGFVGWVALGLVALAANSARDRGPSAGPGGAVVTPTQPE